MDFTVLAVVLLLCVGIPLKTKYIKNVKRKRGIKIKKHI